MKRQFAGTQEEPRLSLQRADSTLSAAHASWSGARSSYSNSRSPSAPQIEPLSSSGFELWVKRRAAVVVAGSLMLRGMEQRIAETDAELLLKIKDGTAAARLQVLIVEIVLLLNDLFQSLPTAANARDPLT